MELIRLCVTRIYAHWSTDESHLQNFMNEIISHFLTTPPSIPSSNNLQDFRLNSVIDTQKQQQQQQQTPQQQSQSRIIFPTINPTEVLPLVFDELCGRADMIGFIRFISDGVGSTRKGYLQSNGTEISNICIHIIEPICQRLDLVSSSGKIPVALRCTLSAIFKQSHGDERIQNNLLLLFVDSLLPRITRWLLNSSSSLSSPFHSFGDDGASIGEQTQLVETIQDLLKICFTRANGTSSLSHSTSSSIVNNNNYNNYNNGFSSNDSNYSLRSRIQISNYSLQTHATLSRSKWLISRYVILLSFFLK